MKTIFEKSEVGQRAFSLPKEDEEFKAIPLQESFVRKTSLKLPEVSELNLMRHFSLLAKQNMGIDTNFYPLGSCTMKYNPRINEWCAGLKEFAQTHPLAPVDTVQGNLHIIFELLKFLKEVTGMSAGSLVPNAGAQGEFVGIRMIDAYHRKYSSGTKNEILVPDNAHGTNSSTAAMAGYKIISIKSDSSGDLDLSHLKNIVSENTAALMFTNPNTMGLLSRHMEEIYSLVHGVGAFLYYDGANLNSILNVVKPADMGFDVMHINLHKTFSTPHGGGGPGSGPVLCQNHLKEFLPLPRVEKGQDGYTVVWEDSASIGQVATFHGNFAVFLRAYLYCLLHGHYGLRKVAEAACLNANYLKRRLNEWFKVPYPQRCMHEFTLQVDSFLDKGIRALDIAKRLLDFGMYAPTVYFPLIVKECMLIEPTETESKATLDAFVEAMAKIVEEIKNDPEIVKTAPHKMPVGRLDETFAAKKLLALL